MQGRIINLNGGVYQVDLGNKIISVKARGKLRNVKTMAVNTKSQSKKEEVIVIKQSPKVGDIVLINNDMIDKILDRKNELIRPDIANVDQILLVFAAKEPDFSFYLLDLFIANITKQNIEPLIVISKIDKLSEQELIDLRNKMSYYIDLGYPVLFVDSKHNVGVDGVIEHLKNKVTVLSGQTGAGKSTLINAIFPDFQLQTQEISYALGRGKHTTRQTTLYKYYEGYIGDTPGFSKLDVLGIEKKELKDLFIDFDECCCRFKDCIHQKNAKDCGVANAVSEGKVLKSRYDSYLKMLDQITMMEKR